MDDGQIADLLDRYAPLVCSVAKRYGLHPDEVDDVYCSTVMWAWEHRDKVDEFEHFARWLASIARFKTLEHLREQRRARGVPIDQVSEPLDEGAMPEELAILAENQARVLEALEKLTPKQRQLIALLFLSPDLPSYAEIARTLGVSIGTLGRMRKRALERLRKLLDEP